MRVVAPVNASDVAHEREATGPAPVQAPVTLSATLISPSVSLPHIFPVKTGASDIRTNERKAYIHIVQSSGYNTNAASGATIKVSSGSSTVELREGDGAYIWGEAGKELTVENVGDRVGEVLLFDVE